MSLTSKKGQGSLGLFEILLVVAVLFIIAFAWLVSNNVGGLITDSILEGDFFQEGDRGKEVLESNRERSVDFYNNAFILFVMGMFFLGGVSAWYGVSNPIFLVITFLLIVMVLIIPVLLGSTWDGLQEQFDETDELGLLNFIMSNYLGYSVVFVFFVLAVMFFRVRLDS